MLNSPRAVLVCVILALPACATFGLNLQPARPLIAVVNGVVRPCREPGIRSSEFCPAVAQLLEVRTVRSYRVPRDSAELFFGEQGRYGAIVAVTPALEQARAVRNYPETLMIIGGIRSVCSPMTTAYHAPRECRPPTPDIAPENVGEIIVIRAARALELFGLHAAGGAIIVVNKKR
jgi:hypothetical protein